MKLVSTILVCLSLAACGGGGGGGNSPDSGTDATTIASTSTSDVPVPQIPEAPVVTPSGPPPLDLSRLSLSGYTLKERLWNGNVTVESELVKEGTGIGIFHQCVANHLCYISKADVNGAGPNTTIVTTDICRFPYRFDDNGVHYLACGHVPVSGDVYLYKSDDGITNWTILNDGKPIVRQGTGAAWAEVWNVAIQPVNGVWHMLAEVGDGHGQLVGLAYATTDPKVSLDFTANEGQIVIPNGGNPYLMYKNGKLVSVHGIYGPPWFITMSDADVSKPLVWTTHQDKLMIQETGVDVCDPSYVEVNGEGWLSISYDQRTVLVLKGPTIGD